MTEQDETPRPGKMFVSIVVPCCNEEEGLREFHRQMTTAAGALCGQKFELILVDDGSTDNTWKVINELLAEDRNVVAVRLARNHGHQLALTAGLSIVRGDLVLVIDADLQDPPELLTPMYEMMAREGADVVYGQRRSRAGETHFKKWSAEAFYRLLARITRVHIPVDTGDFRLMSRRISDQLVQMPEHDRFIRGMVAWLGYKQVAYEYDRNPRFAGSTKYPLLKMISFAADALISFSMVPLRIATYVGALLTTGLTFVGIAAVISWIFSGTVPGWTSLTLLVVMISSVQLLVLGLIGEYVGRIYIQSKNRPLFLISQIHRRGRVPHLSTDSQDDTEKTPLKTLLARSGPEIRRSLYEETSS
ncbi:glycosyltransferase family 2 protein [Bradyrhizobium ontarionense]|uniref:Glycosyltransferase family 2 protein n=2 Tax=Bradyrhizobium ontarionense TaxID=2898149 RepID=A0ABY3R4N2_9BRAD|nr:glycosyltransferase family 2 protein [Bradyrhizobium sp. A19]UFZ02158.1 glycosyltransferase family 2 protein [Bradyrhizobium sp. A19]